ncbi:MAG: flagellar basal body P-ring formation protein FlgA [Rhodospirillales bacterium]|nr:flagellar basal body P-ring formation protein FlgA [Rhodospirillales bacterium]
MESVTITKTVDLTFRLIVLTLSVTLGLIFLFAGARTVLAASLKHTAVVTKDVLTVGDLFEGLPDTKASYPLGPAPQPGQEMVLNARTLYRIAAALDLPWQPSSTAEQVTVRRSATLINTTVISEAIEQSLHDQGLQGHFNLAYDMANPPEMILPGHMPVSLEIADLRYDAQKGRFEARLAAPSREHPESEMTVTGQIERMVSVPVLKNVMRQDDIIGQADITWLDVREKDLQHDVLLNEDDLLGMTPRRMALSGQPLRAGELIHPEVVERGAKITLVYKEGPLNLTARGKAMQNGAVGDLIRVVNLASNRTVEGFVSGPQEVTIASQ